MHSIGKKRVFHKRRLTVDASGLQLKSPSTSKHRKDIFVAEKNLQQGCDKHGKPVELKQRVKMWVGPHNEEVEGVVILTSPQETTIQHNPMIVFTRPTHEIEVLFD